MNRTIIEVSLNIPSREMVYADGFGEELSIREEDRRKGLEIHFSPLL